MEFDMPRENNSIIKVIGVGGGGSNAVNHMYNQGIKGVDFIVCNTDRQALDISPVPFKIQLGPSLTEGLGAGSIPEIGKNAAIENIEDIRELLSKGTKMVFVTAGMGGGTGTGAAPVIAQVARELGILTVGIVTIPFNFEGKKRRQQAEDGLEQMRGNVDTLLVINNERLREISGNLSLTNAFSQADDVVNTAAKGIAEVISVTGNINVDFKDVNTVMRDSGHAIMGSASAEGENRALRCVQDALNSPLLNDNNIEGAKYVLLNITFGDKEVTMDEISEITDYIQEEAGSTADVIWGYGPGDNLGEKLCVTIIATGFNTQPLTGLDKAPEKKVVVLEDTVKEEVVKPLDSPFEKTMTQAQVVEEPFLKNNIVEITDKIETPLMKTEVVGRLDLDFEPVKEEYKPNVTVSNEMDWEIKREEVIEKPVEYKAPEKVVLNLDDDQEDKFNLDSTSSSRTGISPEEQQRLASSRMERINQYTKLLKKPEGLNKLEVEPAYKRRSITIDKSDFSSQSSVSRFNISTDENGSTLRSNNSFLHDNVD
jgi:cell division protein FtsZ